MTSMLELVILTSILTNTSACWVVKPVCAKIYIQENQQLLIKKHSDIVNFFFFFFEVAKGANHFPQRVAPPRVYQKTTFRLQTLVHLVSNRTGSLWWRYSALKSIRRRWPWLNMELYRYYFSLSFFFATHTVCHCIFKHDTFFLYLYNFCL